MSEIRDSNPIEVFWRPGCAYCALLLPRLRRSGLPLKEVNIWEDSEAATRLRELANGNETVPTVVVRDIAMVNPSLSQVLAEVRRSAPHLEPPATPAPSARPAALVMVGLVASWTIIAAINPTTTYHLAPLLISASAPFMARQTYAGPVAPRTAALFALAGILTAVLTAAILATNNILNGPGLIDGISPFAETPILAILGSGAALAYAVRGFSQRKAAT